MPYMNQIPGAGGGSVLNVGPFGGAGGGGAPGAGGNQQMFLEMLAQARADKLRRQREEEAMAEREMLFREEQGRQGAASELARRQFAERELEGYERGQGQRLALEAARTRSDLQAANLRRKTGEAELKARTSRIPKREFSGFGALHTTGKLARPDEMTAMERQAHGFSGYNIPPHGG